MKAHKEYKIITAAVPAVPEVTEESVLVRMTGDEAALLKNVLVYPSYIAAACVANDDTAVDHNYPHVERAAVIELLEALQTALPCAPYVSFVK